MKNVDRKIRLSGGKDHEIEILDKDNRKHLFYATVIGVTIYICALAIIGVH